MSGSRTHAKVIRTRIVRDSNGVYSASSEDLKGLVAVSKDFTKLTELIIPRAIEDLYLAIGEEVIVDQLEDVSAASENVPWVAFPVMAARRSLERIAQEKALR